MFNLEWAHVIFAATGVVIGGASGLAAGVWKVAHIEQDIRKDFAEEIAEAIHDREEKMGELAHQFDETLKALRQKINDVELATERRFLPRGDFDDFREEYRQDMRDLKNSVAEIARTH